MSLKTDIQRVIDDAKRQGWRHEVSGGGHHKLWPPGERGSPIVVSATPSDHRTLDNFLAFMRKAGYKEADDREELMERRMVRGVRDAVRDILRSAPDKTFRVDELRVLVQARVPGSSPKSLNSTMSRLMDNGEVKRAGYGEYRWGEHVNGKEEVMNALPQETEPAQPAPSTDEDDERELNEVIDLLMVAMTRAEKLLRKYNAIIKKAQELKRLLG